MMVNVQQVKEEKLRNKEEYRSKKSKSEMSLGSRRVVSNRHNFMNKRGLHNHLRVLMHTETELSIMAKIRIFSELHKHILQKV